MADELEHCSEESDCLLLLTDEDTRVKVQKVKFSREPGHLKEHLAEVLGIHADRIRCFHLPMFDKLLGRAVHLYWDLQGVEHGFKHNTDATQLWLIANLPEEPPQIFGSIHGPALLTAEDFHTNEFINLGMGDWEEMKAKCKEIQPSAQFVA